MKNQSQVDAVLEWLNEYGSIEPMQALSELGCYRLSDVIYRLKKMGYKITTTMVTRQGKFRTVRFGKYTLKSNK
ncbi:helix-turn-helix domain-containing protein [methanotrophic endosymbiont of Bathymodiolus puteoserpentis (Logatchev)]|jgi:hypothetical protein|uniref:helix-turn-helix domain-containing protein n=1 Tax=methanotrophic endosymbiont of Bathymodiolus puteoserpentis (Logatchev) TaxID=343235 RepID=UPI0013C85AEF|nr:helix-turn-helix domain-containing protein [methanotrophic endosymbiont of Bathymodiolus puteoserpentis (Logatchev)]SHE22066.1 hypothetical protein BPUTEOMOX_633 [methanotrophic endosymbiont of Bathymodiolus puteoserpentis (Logatchev)]